MTAPTRRTTGRNLTERPTLVRPEEQLHAAEEEARQILEPLGADAPAVDFSSNPIDPAAARAINESLRHLVADYPDTVRQLKNIGSTDPANAFDPTTRLSPTH